MQPDLLPEFLHDLAAWTRRSAPSLWAAKAAQGSPFWWPPHLQNPQKDALTLRHEAYNQALLSSNGLHHVAQSHALATQQEATAESYKQLAYYHAETLEQATPYYVGKDITYLAARTQMGRFRLELDKIPHAAGFIMWDTPIGEAEPRGRLTAQYDNTGRLIEVDLIDDIMEEFAKSPNPINAASWRILPGAQQLALTFYTDGQKAKDNYDAWVEGQKAEARAHGMTIDKEAMLLQRSDPQPLEREQILPIGETLNWFDDPESEGKRLTLTVQSDPSYLREAEKAHVADKFIAANEKVLPMLTQMVKTFVATLSIRQMKLASRQEIPPPKHSQKRMRRSGASEQRQQSSVEVIRIGKPLKHRTGSPGTGKKWTVKTIVGPVIRTRQYVPAHDEYRDGIWEIEPYVAGDPNAPWSERARVFLLE